MELGIFVAGFVLVIVLTCVVLFNTYLILISQKKIYKQLTENHANSTTGNISYHTGERPKYIMSRD